MLSVIVPVLNERTAITSLLDSFAKKSRDIELIICDGGSSDGTLQALRQSTLDNLIVLNSPRGRANQMNAGAKKAAGDILLFLHADTCLPEEAFGEIEQTLADARVAGGRFRVKLDNPTWPYRIIAAMINWRDAVFGGFTGDQAIFIRRSVFKKIGGFRPLELCEDLDMARRLKQEGKVVRLRTAVMTSSRRWEKSGLVRTVLVMWLIRILFYAGVPSQRLARIYADVR